MDQPTVPFMPPVGDPFLSQSGLRNGSQKNVAEALIDQLEAWGVRVVYGVVGDAILPFVAALGERGTMEFVATRHEEAAAFMAKAHATLTGEIGVCTATSGPGAAHLVNGLADAKTDSAPVLAITGQVESYRVGAVYKQMINQQQLMSAVAQLSVELTHPAALPEIIGRALRTAVAHSAVAHLSVPKDFWSALAPPAPPRAPEPYLKTPARSLGHVIDGALALLHRAARPLILVGHGARRGMGDVYRLAERLRAPIVYTLASAGQIHRAHHLVVGGLGEGGATASMNLLLESDCILRLGTTWWPKEYTPEGSVTIDVNVRPDHLGMGSPTAYGVVGPIEEVVPALSHRAPDVPRPEWESRVAAEKGAWEAHLQSEVDEGFRSRQQRLHPALIVRELSDRAPANAVIALDVGDHVLWFNRHFRGSGQQDVLISGYWRSMGFGLPAAIACKKAAPHRPVIAVVGDGGLGMILAEITTAVQCRLGVAVVVFNNRSLGMEEHEMEKESLPVHGVKLHNPNFARYAELCGGVGIRVDDRAELGPALDRALWHAGEEGRIAVVDVTTAATPVPSMPKLQAAFS